jgi:protoporphyrinogen oxidase
MNPFTEKESLVRGRIGIIGGGIAGLTAAYYLREFGPGVVVIERESRFGGRIYTEMDPLREHGAEYLVSSESPLKGLMKSLNVRTEDANVDAKYYFAGRWLKGGIKKVFKSLANEGQRRGRPPWVPGSLGSISRGNRNRTLSDGQIRFLEMIFLSDTCSPMSHWDASYIEDIYEYLTEENWYRVKGGTGQIIRAVLYELCRSGVQIARGVEVKKVRQVGRNVEVRVDAIGRSQKWVYDTVVLATPAAERLLGIGIPNRHFHAYISVNLCYKNRPKPVWRIPYGVYMDNELNFMRGDWDRRSKCYVVRVLIPFAERLNRKTDAQLSSMCNDEVRKILCLRGKPFRCKVVRWKYGLACGIESKTKFRNPKKRIFLAGDRFGKWASMDSAVESAKAVAKRVKELIK